MITALRSDSGEASHAATVSGTAPSGSLGCLTVATGATARAGRGWISDALGVAVGVDGSILRGGGGVVVRGGSGPVKIDLRRTVSCALRAASATGLACCTGRGVTFGGGFESAGLPSASMKRRTRSSSDSAGARVGRSGCCGGCLFGFVARCASQRSTTNASPSRITSRLSKCTAWPLFGYPRCSFITSTYQHTTSRLSSPPAAACRYPRLSRASACPTARSAFDSNP